MFNGLLRCKGIRGVLSTAALHVVIVIAVLMSAVFGQTAQAARGGDHTSGAKTSGVQASGAQTSIASGFQPTAQLPGSIAIFETLPVDLEQALELRQVGTSSLPQQSAQIFALSGCHFLRLPESPSQKHCEHVVNRATYSSRVKLLRRVRTDVKSFIALPISQHEMVGVLRTTRIAIPLNRLKPRSPFKAMYAVTSRMLN